MFSQNFLERCKGKGVAYVSHQDQSVVPISDTRVVLKYHSETSSNRYIIDCRTVYTTLTLKFALFLCVLHL